MKDKGIQMGLVQSFSTNDINTQKAFWGFRKMFRDYLNKLNVGFYDSCCPAAAKKVAVFYDPATNSFSYIDPVTGISTPVGIGKAPTANAGPDQSLATGTTTAPLNSTGSTAGSGTITSRLWSKVSGPGTQVITTPTAATTTITGLVAGTFVIQVAITNSAGLTSTDTMEIVVAA